MNEPYDDLTDEQKQRLQVIFRQNVHGKFQYLMANWHNIVEQVRNEDKPPKQVEPEIIFDHTPPVD